MVCLLNIVKAHLSVCVQKRARRVLQYGSSQCRSETGSTRIAVWVIAMLRSSRRQIEDPKRDDARNSFKFCTFLKNGNHVRETMVRTRQEVV